MKKNTLYIASFVVAAMILQSFTPNLSSSNDKDQKKQKGHEKHNNEHDDHDNGHSKGHGNKNNSSINIKIELGKDLKHNKDEKEHDKGRGHDNGEHNGHGDYADNNEHNNFGQQRAYEARNKHNKFKPNNEREAFEGIQIVINRNNSLVISIKQKIELAHKRNKYKHDNGLISLAIFNSNKRQLDLCEARRVSLDLHISL